MKNIKEVAAQGDLYIRAAKKIPAGYFKQDLVDGKHILAFSETHHHHVVDDTDTEYFVDPKDTMKAYLVVKNIIGTCLKHLRDYDTHESLLIPPGIYELRRQREYVPQGWRRVED